ncbi:MAG: hypothetical protein QOH31_5232 [Verrucomicrobiota bacterium]|jgi:hypothetical protein
MDWIDWRRLRVGVLEGRTNANGSNPAPGNAEPIPIATNAPEVFARPLQGLANDYEACPVDLARPNRAGTVGRH